MSSFINGNINNRRRRQLVLPTRSVITRSLVPRVRQPMELRAMSSSLVTGQADPVPVDSTIKVQHRVQLVVSTSATANTPTNITVAMITAAIPGSTDVASHFGWEQFRLMKIDAWGIDTNNLIINVNNPRGDTATFTDWGTPGARRAALHIRPNFEVRSNFIATSGSGTTSFFSIASGGTTVGVILNLTLEIQSFPPSALVF